MEHGLPAMPRPTSPAGRRQGRRRSSSSAPQALATEWEGRHRGRAFQPVDLPCSEQVAAGHVTSRLQDVLATTFLPEGYPESVSPDYLGFQVWDTAQAVSSYVRGMLSSHAIMTGIGVGSEAATAYGAVFLFAVRDLTGMIGGLVFAHLEGSGFDSCAKQWRLFADIMNDLAYTMDLASPMFPQAFLAVACLSSLARACVGVAGGATRAALTVHFAKRGNAADIAAKEQSQETCVTALGMMMGIAITRLFTESMVAAWALFLVLTVLHVWANVKAMRALVLTSINQPRLDALLEAYFSRGEVLSPVQMAAREDLTPPPFRRLQHLLFGGSPTAIRLGASLSAAADAVSTSSQLADMDSDAAVGALLRQQGHRRYLLVATSTAILVVLHREHTAADVLQAYVHAWKVCHSTKRHAQQGEHHDVALVDELHEKWVQGMFPHIMAEFEAAGWQLDHVRLPMGRWTAEWRVKHPRKKSD